MNKRLKIIFILFCIILFWCCRNGNKRNEWESVKIFKSLPNLVENKDFRNLRIGFLNERIGFAINRANLTSFSNDGGEYWSNSVRIKSPCMAMDIINEKDIVIGCVEYRTQYSNDSGNTWIEIEESDYPFLSFYNSNSGMIAKANTYNIIKFIKDYRVVNEIKLPKEYERTAISAIACVSENLAFILFYGKGPLLKTQDGGRTWEKIDIKEIKSKFLFKSTDATSMRFMDINNGIIITFDNDRDEWISLITKDGGKSWIYSIFLKVKSGFRSYLSKDGNYLTVVNSNSENNPVVLLKRKLW